MEYVVTGLVVLGFGYFIYKKVTAKKTPSSGSGGGAGGSDSNTQQH